MSNSNPAVMSSPQNTAITIDAWNRRNRFLHSWKNISLYGHFQLHEAILHWKNGTIRKTASDIRIRSAFCEVIASKLPNDQTRYPQSASNTSVSPVRKFQRRRPQCSCESQNANGTRHITVRGIAFRNLGGVILNNESAGSPDVTSA